MADASAEDKSKIVERFQKLREEQANIVGEISRIDEETREHERVLKLLEDLDGERVCHHLVSDSLVEMRVNEIVPFLQKNLGNLNKVKETLNSNLVEKGKELNSHKEKHNIRFISEKEAMQLKQQQLQAAAPVKK